MVAPNDQDALETFLRPPRAPILRSSFLSKNSRRRAGLIDRGRPLEGTYYAAFDEDDGRRVMMVGVVAHYWQGNLVWQCPRALEHIEPLLAATVTSSGAGRPILGLLGLTEQVARALELLLRSPEARDHHRRRPSRLTGAVPRETRRVGRAGRPTGGLFRRKTPADEARR